MIDLGEMDALSTILVAVISGVCVAAATKAIEHLKDSRTYLRDRRRERFERMSALYAEYLAVLEKGIRQTTRLEHYSYDELPLLNARFALTSPEHIVEQAELVSHLLEHWSTEYRRGSPKKLDDSGFSITSSHDAPHLDKARELYPKLMEECTKLIHLLQEHLKALDT